MGRVPGARLDPRLWPGPGAGGRTAPCRQGLAAAGLMGASVRLSVLLPSLRHDRQTFTKGPPPAAQAPPGHTACPATAPEPGGHCRFTSWSSVS